MYYLCKSISKPIKVQYYVLVWYLCCLFWLTTVKRETPPKERKQNFKTKKLKEPIRGGQEVPHPLTLTRQSVANKTSLVTESTNPLKLTMFPTIHYKNRSPPSLGALSAGPLGCVEGVPAPACNKVPHCFCIDSRLLWCLVGFWDPGTTQLSWIYEHTLGTELFECRGLTINDNVEYCTGLNSIPSKSCLLTTQNLRIWPYLEIGSLQM